MLLLRDIWNEQTLAAKLAIANTLFITVATTALLVLR